MARASDFPGGSEGEELTVEFTVLGQPFVGLNGGPNFKPNEAVSFMVLTEDQEETDRYWNAITKQWRRGKHVRLVQGQMGLFLADHAAACCSKLNTNPDKAAAKRAFEAMMTMQQDRHRRRSRRRSRAKLSMRKLTGAVFLSLDGVMQAPGGPEEDPTERLPPRRLGRSHFWDATSSAVRATSSTGDYDLLLGKRTYDIFAAYWPYNQDNPIGEKFQRINKYVLTHSDAPLDWENSHKLSGDTADAVAELKQSEGRDLLIQGSSTLYPPLLVGRLIDRLMLMTFPVVLGEGKRIFDGSAARRRAQAHRAFRLGQGRHLHDLRPDGDVQTGTFETKEPSEGELERREKIKEGPGDAWSSSATLSRPTTGRR